MAADAAHTDGEESLRDMVQNLEVTDAVATALERWNAADGTRRLWERDASLWTGGDESQWLGWLSAPDDQQPHTAEYRSLAESVRGEGIRHAVLLGMGGSSLCCEVLADTFGPEVDRPILHVVDSTVPGQVRAVDSRIDPARSIVIVSSKSGSTLETDVLRRHYFEHIGDPNRFIAITDPDSQLEARAREEGWRAIVHGQASIGGRFSALSAFGLLPGAIIGLDIDDLLTRARALAASEDPGISLGVSLGALALAGRDKLTIVASPGVASLGAWLEQLIAESTGKNGKGIVPLDGEPPTSPDRYGDDRVFAYVRLTSAPDAAQDAAIQRARSAGHPVLQVDVAEPAEIGAEFFRWEIATAVAGSVLGVHPFDQPDVEAAKVSTRDLMATYAETGSLPDSAARLREEHLELHTDDANAAALGDPANLVAALRAHLTRLAPGDYVAINAFVERTDGNARPLDRLRSAILSAIRAPTSLGFGPRFLHSTGQLHKGGPDNAIFIEITAHDPQDLSIPGQGYSFGTLKDAQARGDFDVLCQRGRRAIRIHIAEGHIAAGLSTLADAVTSALA
jgi:transaldolase/glucose-6-phosphate isomerase